MLERVDRVEKAEVEIAPAEKGAAEIADFINASGRKEKARLQTEIDATEEAATERAAAAEKAVEEIMAAEKAAAEHIAAERACGACRTRRCAARRTRR